MFNFAVERDIIPSSPCVSIKSPSKENPRDRYLSEKEIGLFWKSLDEAKMPELIKIALRFQLTTGQRIGEVVALEWSHLEGDWWSIAGDMTKNEKSQTVYLSPLASQLLRSAAPHSNDKWVFQAPRGNPFRTDAISRAVKDHKFEGVKEFTPHDLRRTTATHMSILGINRLVISKILNHVEKGVTGIHYDHNPFDNEKKEALLLWSDKLTKILG
jgi:integrase